MTTRYFVLLLALILCAPLRADDGGTISFTYQIGGTAPPAQSINIVSSDPNFQIPQMRPPRAGQPWLAASISSTVPPLTLTISVGPFGLQPEIYSGTVELSSPYAISLYFDVVLTVQAQAPPLTVSPSGMAFNVVQGGAVPDAKLLQIGDRIAGTGVYMSIGPPAPDCLYIHISCKCTSQDLS